MPIKVLPLAAPARHLEKTEREGVKSGCFTVLSNRTGLASAAKPINAATPGLEVSECHVSPLVMPDQPAPGKCHLSELQVSCYPHTGNGGHSWCLNRSLSLSVGFSIGDVARCAPQGAHYHAGVIYLPP